MRKSRRSWTVAERRFGPAATSAWSIQSTPHCGDRKDVGSLRRGNIKGIITDGNDTICAQAETTHGLKNRIWRRFVAARIVIANCDVYSERPVDTTRSQYGRGSM